MARPLLFTPFGMRAERYRSWGVWYRRRNAKIMDTRAIHKDPMGETSASLPASSEYAGIFMSLLAAVFLTGCSTEFMQSVKTAATEMTTTAPVLGPYDPPQPSDWTTQAEKAEKPAPPAPAPVAAATPPSTPVYTAPQGMVEQPRRFNEPKVVVVKPASVVAVA